MYRLKLEELAEEINAIEESDANYRHNPKWIYARRVQNSIYAKMKEEEMEK